MALHVAPVLGCFPSPVVGLLGVALGLTALSRPEMDRVGRRGRAVALVGIALGLSPLLFICVFIAVGPYVEGLGFFGHCAWPRASPIPCAQTVERSPGILSRN